MYEKLAAYNIILGSKSPRRQELLRGLGLTFTVKTKSTSESFDSAMEQVQIAPFLARKKAAAFDGELAKNDLLITADTIVCLGSRVLNKPESAEEAHQMLSDLSGKMHRVYTGVCLRTLEKEHSFVSETKVYFKELTSGEIDYYITHYKPYDKAGSYGAQEWMGYIAIERLEGSYFNVMGLPVHKLYRELMQF